MAARCRNRQYEKVFSAQTEALAVMLRQPFFKKIRHDAGCIFQMHHQRQPQARILRIRLCSKRIHSIRACLHRTVFYIFVRSLNIHFSASLYLCRTARAKCTLLWACCRLTEDSANGNSWLFRSAPLKQPSVSIISVGNGASSQDKVLYMSASNKPSSLRSSRHLYFSHEIRQCPCLPAGAAGIWM